MGQIDRSRVIKCRYVQKGDKVSTTKANLKVKSVTKWKHITIEVKKRIDLDGCPAYIVSASDMMSQQKKSIIVDAQVIDEQDVVQLE